MSYLEYSFEQFQKIYEHVDRQEQIIEAQKKIIELQNQMIADRDFNLANYEKQIVLLNEIIEIERKRFVTMLQALSNINKTNIFGGEYETMHDNFINNRIPIK